MSSVEIKSPKEIETLRRACRLAAETLLEVGHIIRPGITTDDINRFVHEDTLRRGARPAPLNYHGFPKSVCTSINEVVCHGIPGSRETSEMKPARRAGFLARLLPFGALIRALRH